MKQIIRLQGKAPKVELGKYHFSVKSSKSGVIRGISNRTIAKIARIAGCPKNKGAGIYLNVKVGEKIKRGQLLYTIYAENKSKMDLALEFVKRGKGYIIE